MLRSFGSHIRDQWIGVIALFIALATGTAYAANTVLSSDIVDGEVKTVDLAGAAVTTAKLAGGAVTTEKVKDDNLAGRDVRDNSLKGADIDESTLSGLGGGVGPADFGADDVIQLLGPLPVEGTYTSKGGTLFLSISGSAFRGTGTSLKEGRIGIRLTVDGGFVGRAAAYTNERNSHKALVSAYEAVRLPAGTHTIRLEEYWDVGYCNTPAESQTNYCTDTDSNDYFEVGVVEIPD